ncbi:hydrogenase maturation protease [Yinghuangia sp. ASG 101]|uniref:hydrogenase maturation protease n=1 Tax=Yinghuangia sp. ASG 101 TaxID=2896848 RepID=UPI001E2F8D54|nr:hydrogenase maturation protease [Yinghuangia sp. ASG 101]UGQ11491.1 hydrogenase maturation protease [Yinghuangia sp. ASG 101]
MTAGRHRVLIAGVGNIFLADDAFGPEVVTALRDRDLPDAADVRDFGVRGMDLAYRLLDGYAAVLLVDAAPRGCAPGSLCLVEPDLGDTADAAVPEAHGMDPVKVLALARRLAEDGAPPLPRVVVLGCEPEVRMRGDEPDVVVGLSPPVRAAVDAAADWVTVVAELLVRDPHVDLGDSWRNADEHPPHPDAAGGPVAAPLGDVAAVPHEESAVAP